MNLRLFIYISVLIHIVGGIAMYLHYNPRHKEPEVSSSFGDDFHLQEEQLEEKVIKKTTKKPPKKPVAKKLAPKKPVAEKLTPKKPVAEKLTPKKPVAEKLTPKKPVAKKLTPKKPVADLKPTTESTMESAAKPSTPQLETKIKTGVISPPSPDPGTVTKQAAKNQPKKVDRSDMEEVEIPDDIPKEAKKAAEALKEIDLEAFEEVEDSPKKEKEVKTKTLSPKIQKNSISYKNFFDLKQKRGNPKITYPEFARKAQLQGRTTLHYYVTKEGLVDKISLKKSSGHSKIDNHILRLLSRYEFLPNQESWVRHEVNFILEGEEKETLELRTK